jgi:hypothetical protein
MKTSNESSKPSGSPSPFALIAEGLSSPSMGTVRRRTNAPVAAGETPIMRLMAQAEARDTFLVARPLYTRYAPGLTSEDGRAITRSGMWSGVGFVGASLVAAGLMLLINGEASFLSALGLIVGGGALATFGWRSAWKVLDRIDPSSATAGPMSPAAAAGVNAAKAPAASFAVAHPRTALCAA